MNQEQLPLFDDEALTGTGRPHSWPTAQPEPKPVVETPTQADELPLDVEDAA